MAKAPVTERYVAPFIPDAGIPEINESTDRFIIHKESRPIVDIKQMIESSAELYGGNVAIWQKFKGKERYTAISYNELLADMNALGTALIAHGLKGKRIGVIGENSYYWAISYLAAVCGAGIVVPLDKELDDNELTQLVENSETSCVLLAPKHRKTFETMLAKGVGRLEMLVEFDAESSSGNIFSLNDMLEEGRKLVAAGDRSYIDAEIDPDAMNILLFTSGTTGIAKGVMLSHGNFISQLEDICERIYLYPGDRGLLVLPVWHAFERSVEYVVLSQAATLCYSRPVGAVLLADIKTLNPQIIPAVPRVFEAVYDGIFRKMRKTGGITNVLFKFFTNIALFHSKLDRVLFAKTSRFKMDLRLLQWPAYVIPWLVCYPLKLLGGVLVFRKIRAMFGNNFRAGVSGGGALPPAVDKFFWAIGVKLVEGYGLTEMSPIVSVRPIRKPIFGNVGAPIRELASRVVDPATGKDVGKCKKGVLQLKGPTVMKGYYRQPELTAKVIDENGWFNTGDIAILTVNNEICLRGRIKDTIVQTGGENVEPLPIEMKMQESQYIKTAVVLGQDQRYLAALVVPEKAEIEQYCTDLALPYKEYSEMVKSAEVQQLIESEVAARINAKNGFKSYEKINKIALLEKEFEVGKELSAKQEMARYKVNEIYAREIKNLFRN